MDRSRTLGARMPFGVRAAILAVAFGLIAALAPIGGADAADAPRLRDRVDVAPGLVRENYGFQTVGGPNDVQVLRFSLADERLSVRPELARGQVPGKETVDATVRRVGAVAGVNASFFAPSCGDLDDGDPCGLVIQDGLVASENHKNGGDWPGAFALLDPTRDPEGRSYLVDRPAFEAYLMFRDSSTPLRVNGINRQPGEDELVAFNADYAARTGTPSDTAEYLFESVQLLPRTRTERGMPEVSPANSQIPASGTILAARGRAKARLANYSQGDAVEFNIVTASSDWNSARHAIAAGPLILQDGQMTSPQSWFNEGFSPAHHNDRAHPRTIVGFRENGEMLLVTVDGRQSDSVGITTGEAAELMQDLGAVDAVMMDGGGSTTMSVDGLVANDPSGGSPRSVASSVVVMSHVETPDVTRLAGSSRFATAAEIALEGWPDGSSHVLIASGERFPDALAGGPLAAELDAPLLLTASGSVPEVTLQTLVDLDATDVTLLGGVGAISQDVEDLLKRRGYGVTRVSGADRTGTAAAIARRLGAPNGRAFLASATAFPDALSTAVPASRSDAPLLLTWPEQLSEATLDALGALKVKEVLIAGGPVAVSDAVVEDLQRRGYTVRRVYGADRYETSVALVDWAVANTGLPTQGIALASGRDFPDAIAGGPYGVRTQTGVLLTDPFDIDRSPAVGRWIDQHDLSRGVLFGGHAALTGWHEYELQQHIDAS